MIRTVCQWLIPVAMLVATFPALSQVASAELENCHVEGITAMVRCTQVTVPEWHGRADTEQLTLDVVVLPAVNQPASPDPVFALAGGPGQSAIKSAAQFRQFLQAANRQRDVVLVDQRGTGAGSPLTCDLGLEDLDLDDLDVEPAVTRCLDSLANDPAAFGTVAHILDLEMVRQALGYEQVNIYGGSYGTRAGLVYVRERPDSVRSLVLDGVAPLQMRIGTEFGTDGQSTLDQLFQRCAADSRCADVFGDVRESLETLLARLETAPAVVQFEDPATGADREETLTAGTFALGLRALLYAPETQRLIPLLVDQALAGDYQPFIGISSASSESLTDMINSTLMFSVLCSEDLRDFSSTAITQRERDSFLGSRQVDVMTAFCEHWPRSPELMDSAPVSSAKPTLLLSGGLDPVTPPRWAEMAAENLSNSTHVVVENGGHIVARYDCIAALVADFYENPDDLDRDTECVEDITFPSFFTSILGPDTEAASSEMMP